ncbi:MAG: UDP-3-O-acyl-N-acetylglucosamine deacetylase [Planctomycetota bacterium]|nr:UDP-3-O-acyl-N-acetylglucosamine deacetylase [Planctomycetota bacterium]
MNPARPGVARRGVARSARVAGRGLFTGAPGEIHVSPAPAGTGLVFVAAQTNARIPAHVSRVLPPGAFGLPGRNTILALNPEKPSIGEAVLTVEHVLSAASALGVTDAVFEVRGPEVPIADGSAAPFVEMLREAQVIELAGTVAPIVVEREIVVEDGKGGRIIARPAARAEAGTRAEAAAIPGLLAMYLLEYGAETGLGTQRAQLKLEWGEVDAVAGGRGGAGGGSRRHERAFEAGVAPARTFCLRREAEAMRAAGLFKDFSARDLVVVNEDGEPIENDWRLDDEPARHKLLDLIGDLALVGAPIVASVIAERSGHALTHELGRRVLAESGVDMGGGAAGGLP